MLTFTSSGIYCPDADLYIDPWRPVARALITHGHSDHARPGHGRYVATETAAPVIRHRLGAIDLTAIAFGETLVVNGIEISFHPAGHIPDSAQIRLARRGEVWVVSGDYKTAPDALSEPFAPIRCHAFVTECTFGLPVFVWPSEDEVIAEMIAWWRDNAAQGRVSVLGAYSLGKAQRLIARLAGTIGPIFTHGAVEETNAVMRAQGLPLPDTIRVTPDLDRGSYKGGLVIAPPSALGTTWLRRFGETSTAFASGWMAVRGIRRRRAADRGFVVSDHVDWPSLNNAIAATGAERIFVTHGYTAVMRRWLAEQGYDARVVETEFQGESLDMPGTNGQAADAASVDAEPDDRDTSGDAP